MRRVLTGMLFLVLPLLWGTPSAIIAATPADWGMVLAREPNNQTALCALARMLGVPPELVQTRLLANDLMRDSRRTVASPQTFYKLIEYLEALKDYGTARSMLAMYMTMHPRDPKPVLAMAYDHFLAGDHAQALAWYDQAVARFPDAIDGHHGRMLTLITLKRFDEAVECGKYILTVSPRDYFASLRIGNILYEKREFHKAMKWYAVYPDKIDFQLGMGLCHFRLRNFPQAEPLLKAAVVSYPTNPELIEALRYLNDLEIEDLKKQIADPTGIGREQFEALCLRLAELHELNGRYGEAGDVLAMIVKPSSDFGQLVRVAADFAAGGKYKEAGTFYLRAIPLSPAPRATSLAAVDCLVKAGDADQAGGLLDRLHREAPGMDLWGLFGRLCFLRQDRESGRNYFNMLGAELERNASRSTDPRPFFLDAIDSYLEAANHSRARLLLDRMNLIAPGPDLDRKYIRYFSELKAHSNVIVLCAKYPADAALQNTRGWAHIALGERRAAGRVFHDVLRRFPGNAGARAGLDHLERNRPWEFFLGYTDIGYGGYQDGRGLLTESLRFSHKKSTTTLAHTRTDVKRLSPGAVDFNEDLYAGKIWYQANRHVGFQLHGMGFWNDDAETDGGTVLGARAAWFPVEDWVVGLEYDASRYRGYRADQLNPTVGYRFNRFFRADAKGFFIFSAGRKIRDSQDSMTSGAQLKGTYTPHDRFLFSLGGQFGERRQAVDSDGLYSFNTLDLYREGGFARFLYSPNTRWKFYLNYSIDRFESERLEAANEAAGAFLAEPDQDSRTLTTGAMYQF